MKLSEWRTALWHLRHGGPAQLREWRRRRLLGEVPAAPPSASSRSAARGSLDTIPPRRPSPRPAPFGHVRVAIIADEFSLLAWGAEFDTVAVTPSDWRSTLSAGRVDLLFVESAWNGNRGAWQYQLTGSSAPSEALRELVAECRARGIPTVFWNKEDPPHFEDFLATAGLFDLVFTSDVRLLPEYRSQLGHDRVAPMSFAASETWHNPVRDPAVAERGDIAFAGMYFAHKFPERRAQMDLLLGAAAEVAERRGLDFDIFSRFSGGDEHYQFPAPLDGHVVGSLPYDRMLSAYGAYRAFLNVNSVVDSPSMCARRVFEITASGTPVVSTESVAIREFFPGDEVAVVTEPEEAAHVLRALTRSPELRDRMVHRAQRRIWREHSYAHRAATLLEASRVDVSASRRLAAPSVTALVSTNRPGQLDHVLATIGRFDGVPVQLALLTHGFDVNDVELRARARAAGVDELVVLHGDADHSLGACLNRLVSVADGEVLAKIDDDDVYGEQYLVDSIAALRYSGAQLVGKQASYMYLGGLDLTVLRFPEHEHRFTRFVAGPTLVGWRDTFVAAPFEDRTRGEDTAFLRTVAAAGGRVYSADRFNFIQVRGDRAHHTWSIGDAEVLANADVVFSGRHDAHVIV